MGKQRGSLAQDMALGPGSAAPSQQLLVSGQDYGMTGSPGKEAVADRACPSVLRGDALHLGIFVSLAGTIREWEASPREGDGHLLIPGLCPSADHQLPLLTLRVGFQGDVLNVGSHAAIFPAPPTRAAPSAATICLSLFIKGNDSQTSPLSSLLSLAPIYFTSGLFQP